MIGPEERKVDHVKDVEAEMKAEVSSDEEKVVGEIHKGVLTGETP